MAIRILPRSLPTLTGVGNKLNTYKMVYHISLANISARRALYQSVQASISAIHEYSARTLKYQDASQLSL